MKVHILNYEPNRLGGGWTFCNNLAKGLGDILSTYEEADICLIASPSMVQHEAVEKAKKDGKKVVLRVDNIVRNSRNRNTGMSRMKAFAEIADLIVYQSGFAEELLGEQYLEKPGVVILNGCDTSIFNSDGREEAVAARFLYSRVNRDETKNFEMARFVFQQESYLREGNAKLHLVGEFSPELIEYNFDFYMGEQYHYWGVVSDQNLMANIYKQSDYLIYTFWNDACSNTLIEALCSGCNVIDPYDMLETGGASEIWHCFEEHGGGEYFSLERMTKSYLEEMGKLL